jgi:hypothetical protein
MNETFWQGDERSFEPKQCETGGGIKLNLHNGERGSQIFQKSWSHFKILGNRKSQQAKGVLRKHNIRRHRTIFSRPGDLTPEICATLMMSFMICNIQ